MTLRLSLDGLDDLDLSDRASNGLYVTEVEVGPPEVRPVVNPRPGADGTDDTTSLLGDRLVTVRGYAAGTATLTPQECLDRLRRFCHPRHRPTLTYTEHTDGPERTVTLRSDQLPTSPLVGGVRGFQAQWRGSTFALGTARDLCVRIADPAPGDPLPLTFPLDLTDYIGGGDNVATNAGTEAAAWTCYLYGPVTDPVLTLVDTGEALAFTGLTLAAGDVLVIDPASALVAIDGDPDASRFDLIDFTASTLWFQLTPGDHLVTLDAASAGAGAQACFYWSDTYL